MRRCGLRLLVASFLALVTASVTPAHAWTAPATSGAEAGQGGATSTISGVVTDSAGGVVPGATIVVTSSATGTKFETSRTAPAPTQCLPCRPGRTQ